MTMGLEHIEYRRLRAPRDHGSALIQPPLDEVPELVVQNRRLHSDYDFQGQSLADVARHARQELVAEARQWTSQYRDTPTLSHDPARPLLLAGHQPQLFHPGVWLKNFALSELARRQGACAINLIVDSDSMKGVSMGVPGGSVQQPHLAAVPLDEAGPPIPYEERPIVDHGLLESFGRRAAEELRPFVPHPLLESFWPMVVARAKATGNFGACLAQARHQLEGRWGAETLEVPQSRVCDLPSFAWLTAHLLAHLPRLQWVYNEVVAHYRRTHRIRSTAHPVPDLATDDDWLEAPFWIWTTDEPRRRRLFARQRGDEILITNRAGLEVALPLSPEGDAQSAVQHLMQLRHRGVKIRSRALVTTLWARLVLGDLFIHGIGGAKYDQVTDSLIDQFFDLRPPHYLVVSATFHLPIAHHVTTGDELRQINRRLRDLTFHPERALRQDLPTDSALNGAAQWIDAKDRWIATPQTPENASVRFREFHRINAALQPWVSDQRQQLLQRRDHVAAALRHESILSSREYAFCLFPEEMLRRQFNHLLAAPSTPR